MVFSGEMASAALARKNPGVKRSRDIVSYFGADSGKGPDRP